MTGPQDEHLLRILRTYVEMEDGGEDPHDAGDAVAAELGLTPTVFGACLKRLVSTGYLDGGETFAGPFIEGATSKGRHAVRVWERLSAALDGAVVDLGLDEEWGPAAPTPDAAWRHATRIRVEALGEDPVGPESADPPPDGPSGT